MKYCFNKTGAFQKLDSADEIIVSFNDSEFRTLKDFAEFCKNHSHQRIILYFSVNWSKFIDFSFYETFIEEMNNKYPDIQYSIMLPSLEYYDTKENFNFFKKIKEKYPQQKIFFTDKIDNWEKFYTFLNLGVSDMFICKSLGFELKRIKEIQAERQTDITIRVYANVCQKTYHDIPESNIASYLKYFFIRPEDVDLYEDYIDVIEFYSSKDNQNTYYKIYAVDKKWDGDLSEIIINLPKGICNPGIPPTFGSKRINCGNKCLSFTPCSWCQKCFETSEIFKNAFE